jgi:hypothetical protein
MRAIALSQRSFWLFFQHYGMVAPVDPLPSKDEPTPKPSRADEARRLIEEYAADLREIIRKLKLGRGRNRGRRLALSGSRWRAYPLSAGGQTRGRVEAYSAQIPAEPQPGNLR